MGKHSIAVDLGNGSRISQQVMDENKNELATNEWDHDGCSDGDVCGEECIYEA